MTEQRRPWERRDDETDAQWQAFRIFRDLGLGRTVVAAWENYAEARGLASDHPTDDFWDWKRENNWEDRTDAWDRHRDKHHRSKMLEAQMGALEHLADNAQKAALVLAAKAVGEEERIKQQVQGFGEIDAMQLRAINNLLDRVGVETARELIIQGDMEHDHDHEHDFDLGPLLEELDVEDLHVAEQIFDQITGQGSDE